MQEFSIFFFKFILFSQGLSLGPKMFLCGCVIAGLITRSLYMNPESILVTVKGNAFILCLFPPSLPKEKKIFRKLLERYVFFLEIKKIRKICAFCSAVRQERETYCFKTNRWCSGKREDS